MKTYFLLFSFLFPVLLLTAQDKDISVFEKKEGNKNIVIARNLGKVPYRVTLDIHATGMDVEPGLKTEAVIPAGFMKELATITPRPGESWSYGYDVSYIQSIEVSQAEAEPQTSPESVITSIPEEKNLKSSPTQLKPAANDTEIVVYSKPGCSRCAFVRKSFHDHGIQFREVDVTIASPEVNDMWMNLRHGGFNGQSVTMPVVKVKGKLHYNIRDLQQFVSEIQQ